MLAGHFFLFSFLFTSDLVWLLLKTYVSSLWVFCLVATWSALCLLYSLPLVSTNLFQVLPPVAFCKRNSIDFEELLQLCNGQPWVHCLKATPIVQKRCCQQNEAFEIPVFVYHLLAVVGCSKVIVVWGGDVLWCCWLMVRSLMYFYSMIVFLLVLQIWSHVMSISCLGPWILPAISGAWCHIFKWVTKVSLCFINRIFFAINMIHKLFQYWISSRNAWSCVHFRKVEMSIHFLDWYRCNFCYMHLCNPSRILKSEKVRL